MKTEIRLAAFALAIGASLVHAATPIDESRPLDPAAKVSLENIKGRIAVDVWDRDEIRIRGSLGDGAEGLQVTGDANDLRVRIKYPDRSGWFGGWAAGQADESELLVTLPVGVSLDVESVSAGITVKGVAGPRLEVESVSGDIEIESGAKEIEVDSVSGGQKIRARSVDVSVESVSGDVVLRGEVSGRIRMEAVSGTLRLESSSRASSVHAGVVSGDIELRTGLAAAGRISAESLSGDLVVVLPADTSAKVSASSFTGTIRSDHGKVETEEYGPGSSLEISLGSGDGRIELETFSGDLTLRSQ